MSAFIAGTPVAAKVAAKPVARRDATVRAAANSECVPGVATIGMTNTRDVDVIAFSRPTSADAPRPLPPSPPSARSPAASTAAPPSPASSRSSPPRRCVPSTPRPRRRRDPRDPRILSATVRGASPENDAALSISTRRATRPPMGASPPPTPRAHPAFLSTPRARAPSDSTGQRRDQARPRQGQHGPPHGVHRGQGQGPPRVPQGQAGGGPRRVRPRVPPRPVKKGKADAFIITDHER